VKYDLQRLGPFGFQDLAAALAAKTLGAHVQRMGRGRDGGRDMLAKGVLVWGVAWSRSPAKCGMAALSSR
jgi:hypothetical protein